MPRKMDEILNKVNAESIYSVGIRNYSHSKIQEYKKQLKIEAIKATKEKAAYLLEAINEKISAAIEITESDNISQVSQAVYSNQTVSRNSMTYKDASDDSDIGFQKIKLKFHINATFAIQ